MKIGAENYSATSRGNYPIIDRLYNVAMISEILYRNIYMVEYQNNNMTITAPKL